MFGLGSKKEIKELQEKLSQKDRKIGALEQKNSDLIEEKQNIVKINKTLTEENIKLKIENKKQLEQNENLIKNSRQLIHQGIELNGKIELYKNLYCCNDFVPQEQKYSEILTAVNEGRNVFITGGAGVGKSYILNKLKQKYGADLYLTASTGIAAVNIGGMTINSFAGIGIADTKPQFIISSILNDQKREETRKSIQRARMIAIDEISMLNAYLFEYINTVFQGVRGNNLPFGGIQIIAVGDFFQLPPVKKIYDYENKKQIPCPYLNVCQCGINYGRQCICKKRSFVFNSILFENFKVINLTEIKRQNDDKVFASVLNNIRFGRSIENAKYLFKEKSIEYAAANKLNIIHIYARNDECDLRNSTMLAGIKLQEFKFYADDSFELKEKCENPYSNLKEITAELNKNVLAREVLKLKETCRVMLIYNIDVSKGLCNGALGTVTEIDKTHEIITVKFDKAGIHNIQRKDIELKQHEGVLIRNQIPLIPAYGITVHKSQGMTLDKAIICMDKIFEHGQSYTALSRLQSLDGIKFINGYNPQKVFYSKDALHYYLSHDITE